MTQHPANTPIAELNSQPLTSHACGRGNGDKAIIDDQGILRDVKLTALTHTLLCIALGVFFAVVVIAEPGDIIDVSFRFWGLYEHRLS